MAAAAGNLVLDALHGGGDDYPQHVAHLPSTGADGFFFQVRAKRAVLVQAFHVQAARACSRGYPTKLWLSQPCREGADCWPEAARNEAAEESASEGGSGGGGAARRPGAAAAMFKPATECSVDDVLALVSSLWTGTTARLYRESFRRRQVHGARLLTLLQGSAVEQQDALYRLGLLTEAYRDMMLEVIAEVKERGVERWRLPPERSAVDRYMRSRLLPHGSADPGCWEEEEEEEEEGKEGKEAAAAGGELALAAAPRSTVGIDKKGVALRPQLDLPPSAVAAGWAVAAEGVLAPKGHNNVVRLALREPVLLEPGATLGVYLHSAASCSYGSVVGFDVGDAPIGSEDAHVQALAGSATRSAAPFEAVQPYPMHFAGKVEYSLAT